MRMFATCMTGYVKNATGTDFRPNSSISAFSVGFRSSMPSGRNQLSHSVSSACSGIRLSITKELRSGSSPTASQSSATSHTASRTRAMSLSVVRHLVVGDQEVAVVAGLQAHPVLQRARIVAEMQGTGGPDSCQYPLLTFHP